MLCVCVRVCVFVCPRSGCTTLIGLQAGPEQLQQHVGITYLGTDLPTLVTYLWYLIHVPDVSW